MVSIRESFARIAPPISHASLSLHSVCLNLLIFLRYLLCKSNYETNDVKNTDSLLRNPTLSYTQRLEERIKDLEDQLAKAQQTPQSATSANTPQNVSGAQSLSSSVGSHLGYETGEGLTGTFRGLKLDERGVLTYHGATSFFHLPSEYAGQDSDMQNAAHPDDPLHGRRERLVNNAWQQRALEDLSEIPVSRQTSGCLSACDSELIEISRNPSSISSTPTGAGSNPSSISSTGLPLPVTCSCSDPTTHTPS